MKTLGLKTLSLVVTLSLLAPASLDAANKRKKRETDITEKSTHEQVKLIKVTEGQRGLKLNTFCLTSDGNILAGCRAATKKNGSGTGVIREFNAAGDHLSDWKVPVDPEAINVAPDGVVLVAGDGRLFRYSASGKLIQEIAAPHYEDLKANAAEVRKDVIRRLQNRGNNYDGMIKDYEKRVADIKKKKKPTKFDERLLEGFEGALKTLKRAKEEAAEESEPSKEQVDEMVADMIKRKTAVSSISSDGNNIFIATRSVKGYGYAIWRTDQEFANAKQIVTGLSGCCGQMDVQAGENGIYVAENSRHQVVCYDTAGKKLLKWGKGDRKGVEGFSSCCNPMNVCFGKNGDVYTAESNSGRIKRFDSKGKLIDYVGDVKLVPGCKKVSIAVSPDTNRVYMLDITRNHIIVMQSKSTELEKGDKTAKR